MAQHVPLPAIALALPFAATLERVQSQAIRQALAESVDDRGARARGCRSGRCCGGTRWRLSAKPVAAVAGPIAGGLLSGSFAVEIVTSWPGLGRLTYDALTRATLPRGRMRHRRGGVPGARHPRLGRRCSRRCDPRIAIASDAGALGTGGVVKTIARALLGAGSPPRRSRPGSRRTIPAIRSTRARTRRRPACASIDAGGSISAPFFYAQRLENPLELRYSEDVSRPIRLRWARRAALVASADPREPLLLLGGDSLGRDLFSRLLHGARISLGLALVAALGATLIGGAAGAIAGYAGGRARRGHHARGGGRARAAGALRAARAPGGAAARCSPACDFVHHGRDLRAGRLALRRARRARDRGRRTAPRLRRGRRGARREPRRVLRSTCCRPTTGFLRTQFALLLPACILAEATLSFAGLGFPDDLPSWGTLLAGRREHRRRSRHAPWLLAPAVAMLLGACSAVNVAADAAARPIDTTPRVA